MTSDTQAVHEHVLSLLDPLASHSVLDLGCGRGDHLRMLASRMTGSARLIGIDSSQKSIDEALAAVDGDQRFEFLCHDLTSGLPFDDDTFDRVLSVNTLEAIPEKTSLLRDVHRVLRSDGRVVCSHFDWDSQLFDGLDKSIVRKVVHAFSDWKQKWMADADGWMGRRLWRLFQEVGLFIGEVHAYTHISTEYLPGRYGWERCKDFGSMVRRGLISEEEYQVFLAGVEGLARANQYPYAITMFSYVGMKVRT